MEELSAANWRRHAAAAHLLFTDLLCVARPSAGTRAASASDGATPGRTVRSRTGIAPRRYLPGGCFQRKMRFLQDPLMFYIIFLNESNENEFFELLSTSPRNHKAFCFGSIYVLSVR